MSRRLKVLLSAYACEPGRGSEPEVGWQWAVHLARFHDVTVLTRPKSRPAIETALASAPQPHPRFEYYDLPIRLGPSVRGGWRMSLHYLAWQAAIRRLYGRRLAEFDLIHHVTFSLCRAPGFWWSVDRPVLLGPLGGGQVFPWRFLPLLGGAAVGELLRTLVVYLGAINPLGMLCWRDATRILTANRDTQRLIPNRFHGKILSLRETGVAPTQLVEWRGGADPAVVRFVWAGRLVKTKGLVLALRALALARNSRPGLRLTVIGDGPQRGALETLAARLGLAGVVDWQGAVPHAQVPELLAAHDAFLFTSLRDTTGTVIMEAMAAGLSVVTLCHQGAAEATTEETALRVVPHDIKQTVRDLAAAMIELGNSPERRRQLGRAGRHRAATLFSWENRAREMDRLYGEVTAGGGNRAAD